MNFRHILFSFLLIVFVVACKKEADDLEKIQALRKEYWGSKEETVDQHKATRLDSAYKAYIASHPEDTLNPEFLWEAANLHVNALKNPDQAIVLLERLIHQYPDHRRAPQAVFLAGYTMENTLMKPELAKKYYQFLIDKYPNDPFAKQAEISLKYVGKDPSEMLKDILDSNKTQPDTLSQQQ